VQTFYQQWIRPRASDAHYTLVGRITNAAAILLVIGAAYFASGFQSLMEYIQLILSTFNAPLFALIALAMIVPRKVAAGGSAGFLFGLVCAVAHQVLALTHVLHYGSQMAADFYGAILGFSVALLCTLLTGSLRGQAAHEGGLRQAPGPALSIKWPAITAGIFLAGLFILFNAVFW